MKFSEFLSKSGILRSGAVSGTYKNAKDRPTELMMDGVFNAEKDLVGGKTKKSNGVKDSKQLENPTLNWPKYLKIAGIGLLVLIVVSMLFGTPSAKQVFNDSLSEMLSIKSLTIDQEIEGSQPESGLESINLDTTSFIDMEKNEYLTASGKFMINTSGETAVEAEADFVALDDSTYIKYGSLSSDNESLAEGFSLVSSKVKGKWIKTRDNDSFTSIASPAISALTNITPLPFANLNNENRKELLAILQDEKSFTIKESAKVEVDGKSAYRYDLDYDQDKQKEVSNKLSGFVKYFKSGDDDNERMVDSLELWVDIATKRFIKMEYSGSNKSGSIKAVVKFSSYNEMKKVSKPGEYFIESELVQ